MRLVILGQIGTIGEFRAGDETRAAAAVAALQDRLDIEVVALSADPGRSRALHGWESIPCIGFEGCGSDADRDARLEAVVRAVQGDVHGLEWNDPAWAVIHAMTSADAVVVTGGGDLDSSHPEHIYERAAFATIAQAVGRPLVVTGQTVGPHLTEHHGELAARLVTSAVLVGVRDVSSLAVCRKLGVLDHKLSLTMDDLAFHDAGFAARWTSPVPRYLAATFAAHGGLVDEERYVSHLGRLVAHARDMTGLDVVLVPHRGSPEEGVRSGDVAVHDAIREAAGTTGVHSIALNPGIEAAAARGAEAVITTRASAAMFALGGAVPVLAFGTDSHKSMRIGGALESMGMGAFALAAPSLLTDDVIRALDELWDRRDSLATTIGRLAKTRRTETTAWWDSVAEALRGTGPSAPPDLTPAGPIGAGGWSASAASVRGWAEALEDGMTRATLASEVAVDQRDEALTRVQELELELAQLRSTLDDAADELTTMQESVKAAHELTEDYLATIVRAAQDAPSVASLQAQLEAMRATRTFRYLALPRRIWGGLRRRARR